MLSKAKCLLMLLTSICSRVLQQMQVSDTGSNKMLKSLARSCDTTKGSLKKSLFLTVPWVGLQSVIVAFSSHTHLFLYATTLVFVLRGYRKISLYMHFRSLLTHGQFFYIDFLHFLHFLIFAVSFY